MTPKTLLFAAGESPEPHQKSFLGLQNPILDPQGQTVVNVHPYCHIYAAVCHSCSYFHCVTWPGRHWLVFCPDHYGDE